MTSGARCLYIYGDPFGPRVATRKRSWPNRVSPAESAST